MIHFTIQNSLSLGLMEILILQCVLLLLLRSRPMHINKSAAIYLVAYVSTILPTAASNHLFMFGSYQNSTEFVDLLLIIHLLKF